MPPPKPGGNQSITSFINLRLKTVHRLVIDHQYQSIADSLKIKPNYRINLQLTLIADTCRLVSIDNITSKKFRKLSIDHRLYQSIN